MEQGSSGCAGQIRRIFTTETVADVIFGQEDLRDLCVNFGFVFPYPEDFRGGETGHGWITAQRKQPVGPDAAVHFCALLDGALVIPEDGRAQDVTSFIEEDEAMHLPGEADGTDSFSGDASFLQGFADGCNDALPPRFGLLLGPTRLRLLEFLDNAGSGDEPAGCIQQQRFGGGRADIDAEECFTGIHRDSLMVILANPVGPGEAG